MLTVLVMVQIHGFPKLLCKPVTLLGCLEAALPFIFLHASTQFILNFKFTKNILQIGFILLHNYNYMYFYYNCIDIFDSESTNPMIPQIPF